MASNSIPNYFVALHDLFADQLERSQACIKLER